jgi:hypothetical protein
MKKILLFCALFALSGCLDYEEILTLAADGSGTLQVTATVDFAFSEKLLKLSVPEGEKVPEDLDDPYKMLVTREELQKNVQGVEGVTVKQCTVDDVAGTAQKRVKLLVEFKSLDALRRTNGFRYRELSFAEKDGSIEATYKLDVRWLKEQGLLFDADSKPESDMDKKMRKTVEDATRDASARFIVRFPSKVTAPKKLDSDDKAALLEVAKGDAKAHAAIAKDPLVLQATFEKKGNEALLKKPEAPKEDKPSPPKKDGE